MRLGIVGSGSLASFFAATLSPSIDLVMFGRWPEQISLLREHGLTLIHFDGTRNHRQFPVSSDPASVPPVDLALILVKSYQTSQSAHDTSAFLSKSGAAVTLQNGLGNTEILASVLGKNRVVQGVTNLGANVIAPGIVQHTGLGQVYLAETDSNTGLVQALSSLMNEANIRTSITTNVAGLVWGKLAVNAGINPLSALLRVQNGFLVENELACSLMVDAAEEVAAVASELNLSLPYKQVGEQVINVARNTSGNYSSMLKDVLRKAPTEIDAICGAVVRHGQRVGISTPINDEFWRLVSTQTEMYSQVADNSARSETKMSRKTDLESKIEPLNILMSKFSNENDNYKAK